MLYYSLSITIGRYNNHNHNYLFFLLFRLSANFWRALSKASRRIPCSRGAWYRLVYTLLALLTGVSSGTDCSDWIIVSFVITSSFINAFGLAYSWDIIGLLEGFWVSFLILSFIIISGLTILVLIISTSSADESESEVSISLGMSVLETLLPFSVGSLISSSSSSLCRINSKSTCSPTRLEYSGSTFYSLLVSTCNSRLFNAQFPTGYITLNDSEGVSITLYGPVHRKVNFLDKFNTPLGDI